MSYTTILFLLLGLAMIVAGSNYLVDGASEIARRSGLSEFVIGLTIIGIGTSTPEMVVSFLSAFRGQADMAVGNIIGSNIFNTYLILGFTAIILPIAVTANNLKKDIPLNLLATLMLINMGLSGNSLSRVEGAVLLSCFAVYMYFCFKQQAPQEEEQQKSNSSVFVLALMVLGGLAGLILGGRLFVDSASEIARHFGWSEKFIGLTILAGGTSLPELATCIVAAMKRKGQMALGNIIGSNISNILLILGGSALINPLKLNNINITDMAFLLLSALLLFIPYTNRNNAKIGRAAGVIFLLVEGVYFSLLILNL